MKDINMLVWLTQLGLSVALPLIGFAFLGIWLHNAFSLGKWVIWVMLILGILSAVSGFRSSLHAMRCMSQSKQPQEPPPVSFNDHT